MIEQIANYLEDAQASQMHITVKRDEKGIITLIANTVLKPIGNKESDEALALKAAIAKPIVLRGEKGELDINFPQVLEDFGKSFIPAATTYSIIDAKATIEQANKTAQKSLSKSVKTTSVSKAEPQKNVVLEEVPTIANESSASPAPQATSNSDFLTDDADSL
jgi:hypothetical protein